MKPMILRGLLKNVASFLISVAMVSVIVCCPGPIYQPKKPDVL